MGVKLQRVEALLFCGVPVPGGVLAAKQGQWCCTAACPCTPVLEAVRRRQAAGRRWSGSWSVNVPRHSSVHKSHEDLRLALGAEGHHLHLEP